MRQIITFIFFVSLTTLTHSQHNPLVTYYPASQYNAHHQNWDIAETPDGSVLTANTNGLVRGDGNSWKTYSLPSKKIIRSLCENRQKIFTGSHGEFGYWVANECGEYQFTSLKEKIPAGLIKNEEIWNIQSDGDTVWLQSFSVLLRYDKGLFTQVKLPGS